MRRHASEREASGRRPLRQLRREAVEDAVEPRLVGGRGRDPETAEPLAVLDDRLAEVRAEGIGATIWQRPPFVNVFLGMLIPQILQALMLLVCLEFAANVGPTRMPKWLPFVIAATVATIATCIFDGLVVARIAYGLTSISLRRSGSRGRV